MRQGSLSWARAMLEAQDVPVVQSELAELRRYAESLVIDTENATRHSMSEALFACLIRLRARHIPTAYLTGRIDFLGREFRIAPGVFIPRPETESLVLELVRRVKDLPVGPILEVGAGSGVVAVSVAMHVTDRRVVAMDVADEARALTRQNAAMCEVNDRVDVVSTIPSGDRYAAIISNPPYVATGEYRALPISVRDFEPVEALIGGEDGLDAVRRLAAFGVSCLLPGGAMLLETGRGSAEIASRILADQGYVSITVESDQFDVPRIVGGTRP